MGELVGVVVEYRQRLQVAIFLADLVCLVAVVV
jgi:hypothetical protein